jgi:hypothetical protein
MAVAPYKVYIVVDREFGEKLAGITRDAPVWIVDTPINKTVVRRLWSDHPQQNHLTGITTFDDFESFSPEDLLLSEFDTIDLHHGVYSADPPYTVIEVVGTPLTARVKNELSEYGFNEFCAGPAGFTAERSESIE